MIHYDLCHIIFKLLNFGGRKGQGKFGQQRQQRKRRRKDRMFILLKL
jgi:hypothetical protein